MRLRLPTRLWLLLLPVLLACCGGSDTAMEPVDEEAPPEYVPPPVTPASRDLDRADIERLMEELSNWGRWGAADELGAANLITPAKRLEAMALATEGISISLAHPVLKEAAEDVLQPFGHSMLGVPDASSESVFFGGVGDNYNVSYHGYSQSHLDSLCHILSNGRMYNGVSQDTITAAGCGNASIINLQAGIVTRGVLFDLPRLKGVPYLKPGTPIYTEDLDAWEELAGVTVRPGDALFVRIGRWARRAAVGPWNIAESVAGLHASTMPWVKSRDISFIGSDAVLDVVPSQVEGVPQPVHILTIVTMGIDIFDNQDLEALAETAAALNRWEFTLVAAPLAVEGGSGSPINALAIF